MFDSSLSILWLSVKANFDNFLDKNNIHPDKFKNPLPNPAPKRQTLNLGCSCISWQDS